MQNISVHMLIDNIQTEIFVLFDFMKIMIYLAWVANSMVIFSVSYEVFSRVHTTLHLAVRPSVLSLVRNISKLLTFWVL